MDPTRVVAELPQLLNQNYEIITEAEVAAQELERCISQAQDAAVDVARGGGAEPDTAELSQKSKGKKRAKPVAPSTTASTASPPDPVALTDAVTAFQTEALYHGALGAQLATEKMQLAQQTYDLLDAHVRRADDKLKRMQVRCVAHFV
jgi:Inhibitor of growth proteins N-terminal histone-binding